VAESRSRRRGASAGGLRFWPPPTGLGLSVLALGVIFAAHLAHGAIRAEAALAATIAACLLFLGCLAHPGLRAGLLRIRGLAWPSLLFALTLLAGLLSLTPFGPGGPHPVWDYVGQGSGSTTIDPSATLVELIKLSGLAAIFMVGVTTGASDERAKTAINLLIIAAVIFGFWAFFGFATNSVFQTQRGRLEGTLMSPNTAGTFFAALVVVTLGPLMRNLKGVRPNEALQAGAAYWVALLVLSACLLLTASRGAALSAVIAIFGLILLLFYSGQGRLNRASLVVIVVAIAAFGALYAFGGNLLERFAAFDEGASERGALFAMHWRAFLAAPWGGYGLGAFDTIHRTLLDSQSLEGIWRIRATHNVYLQWLEEAGVVGAAPMFACLVAIMGLTLVRAFRRTRMTYVLFALIAANLVFLVHGITDFALQTPSMALMWSYLLGLQLALSQGSRA
jgi:O-antigen ligase